MGLDQFDLGMLQSDEEEHAEEEFDKEVTLYSSFSSCDTYYICCLIHGQLLLFPTL